MLLSWTESFTPATPTTNTDVSTTPLDLRRFCDNGYLRLFLLRTAALPNSALNVPRRSVADILRSLLTSGEKLRPPVKEVESRCLCTRPSRLSQRASIGGRGRLSWKARRRGRRAYRDGSPGVDRFPVPQDLILIRRGDDQPFSFKASERDLAISAKIKDGAGLAQPIPPGICVR
jgi:hypothetical protein